MIYDEHGAAQPGGDPQEPDPLALSPVLTFALMVLGGLSIVGLVGVLVHWTLTIVLW